MKSTYPTQRGGYKSAPVPSQTFGNGAGQQAASNAQRAARLSRSATIAARTRFGLTSTAMRMVPMMAIVGLVVPLDLPFAPVLPQYWNMNGYTENFRCPDGGDDQGFNSKANSTGRCVTLGAEPLASWAAGLGQLKYVAVAGGYRTHVNFYRNPYISGAYWRYNSSSWWVSDAIVATNPSAQAKVPNFYPAAPEILIGTRPHPILQGIHLNLHPIYNRPDVHAAPVQPIPYEALPHITENPDMVDGERSARGNTHATTTIKPQYGALVPLLAPRMEVRNGKPAKAENPYYHHARPPARGEKERKLRFSGVHGKAMVIGSNITESIDFMDVLYNSLPKKYRVRYNGTKFIKRFPTVTEKIKCLYQNYRHIDPDKAFWGFIDEAQEDRFYGKLGQFSAKRARELKLTTGINYGGAQRRYYDRLAQDMLEGRL